MIERVPRLTIGLPVYNGENFIQAALDSLLAQTFEDFEIIISDNASTDRTAKICRAYAERDARIVYQRSPQNLGAAWNFNHLVSLARGGYFKWAAYDDVCAPTFLEKCIAALDQDPTTVLCHSQVQVIDAQGNPLAKGFDKNDQRYVALTNRNIQLKTDSAKAYERFRDLACFPHSCHQVFGVIRLRALRQTPLMPAYRGSDKVMLARLGLLGKYHEIPEVLFFLRRHPEQSMAVAAVSTHLISLWLDPEMSGKLIFPRCRRFFEFFKAVQETPLSLTEKLACYRQLLPLLQIEGPGMLKDLGIAAIQLTESLYRKICWEILQLKQEPASDHILGKFPRLRKKKVEPTEAAIRIIQENLGTSE
jgi:glycosyltransferase involved in cell wall biosynthesis